jgi:hypothetical protein
MRHGVQEWGAAAVERVELHGVSRRRTRRPTPIEETAPREGPGAHGRLVRLTRVAWRRVVALGPAGMPGGCRRPRHTRLAQARRTREPPVDPGLRAAACGHGRPPRLCWECRGSRVALPLCTQGPEEARGTDRPGAWAGGNQRDGGMVLGVLRDRGVDVGHGLPGAAELGHEGVSEEGGGGADAGIRGQRHGALDGRAAGRAAGGRAAVGGPENGLTRGAPRAWRQGAHGGAWGAEWGELVAVVEEELDREVGSGGGVFGMARGQRFAVLGPGARSEGKAPEDIIVAPCRHAGPCRECQAYRDGLAVEARAQGLEPGLTRFRTMCKAQQRPLCGASGVEADLVCRIRPVEAHQGRNGGGCVALQG